AVGRDELDRDLACRVVGLDTRDRGGLALVEGFAADDVFGEQFLLAPAKLDRALDRVGEIRGLDGRAVGVDEAFAQGECVGLAVGGDGRQAFSQAGYQLGAGFA